METSVPHCSRCGRPRELKQLDRVILGTDSPAGSGVQPLGILRMISMLASLGEISAEVAFVLPLATRRKSEARLRNVCAGCDATFAMIDKAQHSAGKTVLESIQRGDLPGSAW